MGDKWTLLIVRDLAAGPRRFVELQRTLPGISTEQLRSRLNRMVADGLLTRQRYREVPPRVDYELTERSRELLPVIGALARWGYGWAWSEPRRGEHVDVGAVLRSATGLLRPRAEGVLHCLVSDEDREYSLSARDGRLAISEQAPERADAVVSGSRERWVESLGPGGSIASLEIQGDRALAEAIIGHLGAVAGDQRAA